MKTTKEISDIICVQGMPSIQEIGRRLYKLRGVGLHAYAYSICGHTRIHQGRMAIEKLPNGIVLGEDYGSSQRFRIEG